jgi:hypothetical protein
VPAEPESAAPLEPEPPLELEPPPELELLLVADPLEDADWPELAPEPTPDDPLEDPTPDGPELEPLVDALEGAEEVPELVPVPSLGDPEPVPAEFVPQAGATAMSAAAMAFGLRRLRMGLIIPGAPPRIACLHRRSGTGRVDPSFLSSQTGAAIRKLAVPLEGLL